MSILVYWAFFSGGIAAFSLTLGSLVGLTLRIPSYIIGILAAFGAGALLSALAIELVAPTVEHLVAAETPQSVSFELTGKINMQNLRLPKRQRPRTLSGTD